MEAYTYCTPYSSTSRLVSSVYALAQSALYLFQNSKLYPKGQVLGVTMSPYPGVAVIFGAASGQCSLDRPSGSDFETLTNRTTGIGRQVALSFAAENCNAVALLDCNEKGLAETNNMLAAKYPKVAALTCSVDVRMDESVHQAIATVVHKFGRIDYAVNAAGENPGTKPTLLSFLHLRLTCTTQGIMGVPGPSQSVEPCEFGELIDTNIRGTWLCCREEAKIMAPQAPLPTHDGREGARGSIINIGSMLSFVGHKSLCRALQETETCKFTKPWQQLTPRPSTPSLG